MAEKPAFSIDDDWKRQAQEEKRKLAEQEAQKKAAASAPTTGGATAAQVRSSPTGAARASRGPRENPQASFTVIVNHLLTQAFYYLGDLGGGGEQAANLDMAKLYVDTLAVLEEKTKGNLTPDETQQLDNALYELRNRFVSVASRHIL